MKHLLVALSCSVTLHGCHCGPPSQPDAGEDAGEFLARPSTTVPPLFDATAGGLDRDLANLVNAWQTVPPNEAAAQEQARVMRASFAALRASGATGADRIAVVCEPVPAEHRERQLSCLRLLSFVESPRSLALLAARARTPLPPPSDTGLPTAQRLTREVALFALTRRASGGSAPALDVLLALAKEPDESIKRGAVGAVFQALPRWRAKSTLRVVLPETEHWRLYQSR